MHPQSPETYRFDGYLAALGEDWLADDRLLQRWLERSQLAAPALRLVESFGKAAATRFRELADLVERRENLPYIEERDPYNRGATRVVLPDATWRILGEIHGSGLWKASLDERARYAVVYLLNQNGEFGVTCSTACTDGLVRILRALGDDQRSRHVVERIEAATPEDWIHGAQFVTEIQGGSDAATNALRAVPAADGLYALYGQKWFCSNLTADYWLVTARMAGAAPDYRGVSLFCVPREHEGAQNGYRIQRLKDKLGTRALPTAEIDLDGALGWLVGPADAGLKNMLAMVLTPSRIHCVLAAAAAARRSAREAVAYAGFREAFSQKLKDHPLIGASLRGLCDGADRSAAGAFATVDAWVAGRAEGAEDTRKLWARVLISVAKAVATRASAARIYEAMMIFGGNGVEERFCALPRLWRDAAIFESWEGPYTLLLMQSLGDLARFGVGGREEAFLRFGLADHCGPDDIHDLGIILRAPTEEANILAWSELAPRLYRHFEEKALVELS